MQLRPLRLDVAVKLELLHPQQPHPTLLHLELPTHYEHLHPLEFLGERYRQVAQLVVERDPPQEIVLLLDKFLQVDDHHLSVHDLEEFLAFLTSVDLRRLLILEHALHDVLALDQLLLQSDLQVVEQILLLRLFLGYELERKVLIVLHKHHALLKLHHCVLVPAGECIIRLECNFVRLELE